MRLRRLTLFIIFLSPIAVVPSFRPHNQLQLGGAALKARGIGPLEARGRRKRKQKNTTRDVELIYPESGAFRVLRQNYELYYPNIGMIILKQIFEGLLQVALITNQPPGHLPTTPVSDFLHYSVTEIMGGIMTDGPYVFQLTHVWQGDIMESPDPRLRWIFEFGPVNVNWLVHYFELVSPAEKVSKDTIKPRRSPQFYPARITLEGSCPEDRSWAFILSKSKSDDDGYTVAVLSRMVPAAVVSIIAESYLGTFGLRGGTKRLVEGINKTGYRFHMRHAVTLSQLEWPEVGSEDDFTIPYQNGLKLKRNLVVAIANWGREQRDLAPESLPIYLYKPNAQLHT